MKRKKQNNTNRKNNLGNIGWCMCLCAQVFSFAALGFCWLTGCWLLLRAGLVKRYVAKNCDYCLNLEKLCEKEHTIESDKRNTNFALRNKSKNVRNVYVN